MNRTLLLILCDFLLLNLLALTRWEKIETTPPASPTAIEAPAPSKAAEDDLMASLRAALDEERAARGRVEESLRGEVAARDATVKALEVRGRELEGGLQRTRDTVADLGQRLTNTVEQAARQAAEARKLLDDARIRAEAEAAKVAATEKARATLAETAKASEAERLRLLDALAAEREQARRQQQSLAAIEQERQAAERRAAELAAAVKVAEAERALLRDNVSDLRQRVQQVQAEKEKVQAQAANLASGVHQLAAKSEELKQEIRDNTPVSANLLFQEFLNHRVRVAIGGIAPGLLGSASKDREAETILVTDGIRTLALVHVSDTPLVLSIPGFGLDKPRATASVRGMPLASGPATFLRADPRCMGVPVSTSAVQKAGVRVLPLARNPFKFPDALLVSRGGKYFGEVEFKLDPQTPGYVRMKTRILSRVFGEFSPSTGDVVLSRQGELLGLMVNGEYCLVLSDLQPSAVGELSGDLDRNAVGRKLEALRAQVDRLPFPLR
jgi:hypothetical protein